ncbi:DUF2158 domain-containing protein [Modicisalibacter sp. MOD 31.J]|uniref:YodC family protein n=1 Tax=Modicisalibacter sp. MOD 31.J TaxID=2831897 RepID=UPI001CCAD454|nr:DUF2158 domain-containing protein [Modicisalibacter sp. MOD 31.J]MBZ9576743.1 DUF2158 domain-containing protein [Modicisalibacter sp. MOD 31.J]
MSSTEKFTVGDTVKLKSGGPIMTVRNYNRPNKLYTCQWFAGKKLEMGHFPEDSLELTEKAE